MYYGHWVASRADNTTAPSDGRRLTARESQEGRRVQDISCTKSPGKNKVIEMFGQVVSGLCQSHHVPDDGVERKGTKREAREEKEGKGDCMRRRDENK